MPQSFPRRGTIARRAILAGAVVAITLLSLAGATRPSWSSQPRTPASPRRMAEVADSAPVAPAPRVAGITARLRAELKNPSTRLLLLDGTFIPHKGRLDVAGTTDGAEVQPSQYLLLGDSTSTLVSTNEETYQVQQPYDIGSLVAMIRAIDGGTVVSNPKVEWDTLPPDTLTVSPAGVNPPVRVVTRHYKFDVEYGLPRGDINAITRAKGEYWLADLPVNFYNPFAGLARPRGSFGAEQAPAISKLYKALKVLQIGTVMKFRAQGVIGEGTERPTIYIRTVVVQNMKQAEVDTTIFDIPKGYRSTGGAAGGRAGGNRGGRGGADTTGGADSTGRGRRGGRGTDTTAGRGRGADTTAGRGRGRGGDTTQVHPPILLDRR